MSLQPRATVRFKVRGGIHSPNFEEFIKNNPGTKCLSATVVPDNVNGAGYHYVKVYEFHNEETRNFFLLLFSHMIKIIE